MVILNVFKVCVGETRYLSAKVQFIFEKVTKATISFAIFSLFSNKRCTFAARNKSDNTSHSPTEWSWRKK
nr:MAG TPA: hypothetical protein [Caudoviricetes sp.]